MTVKPTRIPLLVFVLVVLALFMLALPAAAAPESDLVVALSLDPLVLWPFVAVAGLLALKFVFGVANAYRNGTLDARQLPAVLRTNVLPYLIPLAAMAALSLILPVVKAIYLPCVGLYATKLGVDLKDAGIAFYSLTKPPETAS